MNPSANMAAMMIAATRALVATIVVGGLLAFDPWGWQAFGPSKWLMVTVPALAAAGLAVWKGVGLDQPSLVGWSLLLGWAIVTSLTALDPLSAWLGTPDRRFGVVGLVTLAAAFVAGQSLTEEGDRQVLARSAGIALVGMGIYGVFEAAGSAPVDLDISTTRLGATFGSPAYLGAALSLLLPVAIGLTRGGDRRWRWLGGMAAVAGAGLLVGSATRAALVGLAAAAMMVGWRWWRRLRLHPFATGLAAVALIAVVALSPLGSRVATSVEGAAGRLAEWGTATEAVLARPLLGAGLEGYRIVFPGVVDDDYVRSYGRFTVTDRAHSAPLDMATTLGLVGAVAWLLAAGWLLHRAWGAIRDGDAVTVGLAAGVVGFLVQQIFLFSTLEVGGAAWAVAGALVAATGKAPSPPRQSRFGAALLLALAGLALVVGVLDLAADHKAGRALATGDLAAADSAVGLRPDSFRYPLVAADIARSSAGPLQAMERIDHALELAPLDPALRLARARVVATLALTADNDYLAEAIQYLEGMVDTDPNHPTVRMLLGRLRLAAGDPPGAEAAWLAAEYLSPHDAGPPLALAELYLAVGRDEAARDAVARARAIDPGRVEANGVGERLEES